MNGRPKGWICWSKRLYPPYPTPNEAFEQGADAMLDELCRLAKESPPGKFTIDSNLVSILGRQCIVGRVG